MKLATPLLSVRINILSELFFINLEKKQHLEGYFAAGTIGFFFYNNPSAATYSWSNYNCVAMNVPLQRQKICDLE